MRRIVNKIKNLFIATSSKLLYRFLDYNLKENKSKIEKMLP